MAGTRADAIRNRQKIMAAARVLVTEQGPDVGMDAIAAAAGVAVGTLYRNFPTKRELIRAVVEDQAALMIAHLEDTVVRLRDGADAATEIRDLTTSMIELFAANAAVKEAAQRLGAADHAEHEQRAFAALEELVAVGRAAGALRDEVTAADFVLLVTTAPTDQPKPVRDRWLRIFLAGITRQP